MTKLPATDAEGHELKSTFYVDNAVATQEQNGQTNSYSLDPEGRVLKTVGTGKTASTVISHYDGQGEAVAWSEEEGSKKWTRNIPGMDGSLGGTETEGETRGPATPRPPGRCSRDDQGQSRRNDASLPVQQHRIRGPQQRKRTTEVCLARSSCDREVTTIGRNHLRCYVLCTADGPGVAEPTGPTPRIA